MQQIGIQQLQQADPAWLAAVLTGHTPQAIAWLRAMARQAVPRSQAILGQRLLFGQGVARDAGEALHWLSLAAEADELEAINLVGRCCEHGWGRAADAVMALYWYRLAATRGLDWGMYNLANLMMSGQGTEVDRPGALAWYQQAAARGHAKSINVLGRFFEEGWEMPHDAEQAFAHYRQAAQGGDFRGQFNYARLLLQREQVDQALAQLHQIPQHATPAFMHNLRGWLAQSGWPAVRALLAQAPFREAAS